MGHLRQHLSSFSGCFTSDYSEHWGQRGKHLFFFKVKGRNKLWKILSNMFKHFLHLKRIGIPLKYS